MHELLPETHGNVVCVRVTGKLDDSDFELIDDIFRERISEYGKIRVFWEMHNFEGWTPSGVWADAKFSIRHAFFDVARVAMVGDKRWQERMTKLMKPFTTAEVRYFEPKDRQAALEWVREEN